MTDAVHVDSFNGRPFWTGAVEPAPEIAAAREFGVLFSHAPEGEVYGPFDSWDSAGAYALTVRQAQPGIESVLMVRHAGGEWREFAGRHPHLAALELQRMLWASS